MRSQWLQASGYLTISLMPTLFLVAALEGRPWLAFGVVVIVFPLARRAFGAVSPAGAPEWRESVATALDWLPVAYAPVLVVAVLAGVNHAAHSFGTDGAPWVGLGFSLWMTLLFGTCVAHDLIHRRDKRLALIGSLLAGFCGYPVLGMEHLAHHGRAGDTERAEVPMKDETMWRFAARRLVRIGTETLGPHAPLWQPQGRLPSIARLRAAAIATSLTAAMFGLLAGLPGLALFFAMVVRVSFGIQLITFIQHWGMSEEAIGSRVGFGRGWEEDCQFQAWVTLCTSLHDRHHQDTRIPFYRLSLSADSPRLPAGYVLLMFASMVPGLWRRVMEPAHQLWMEAPDRPLSAGRRLTCFGLERAR